MPPEATSLQLAQRLLILTLAIGEAASRAESSEISALFAERAKLLHALETADSNPEVLSILRQVQLAETDTMARLQKTKSAAVQELQKGSNGRKVQGAYGSGNSLRSFESRG